MISVHFSVMEWQRKELTLFVLVPSLPPAGPLARGQFLIIENLLLSTSHHLASLLKSESGRARVELAYVAVPEIAQEIRLDRGPGEEGFVHLGVIEAGHRTAIETQRPGSQHEVRPLK